LRADTEIIGDEAERIGGPSQASSAALARELSGR
jgi:hypothetical protein